MRSIAIGDFDGDGASDVAVGLPGVKVGKAKDAGEVRLYSGRTGKLLRTFPGTDEGAGYGTAIAAVGDLDGDATTDLAISAPYARPHIDFVSGATGKTHHVFSSGRAIGYADMIVPLGDGSGKARVDIAIRYVKENEEKKKQVAHWRYVYSDREAMGCAHENDAAAATAGSSVGDVDGDGTPDLAVTHVAGGRKKGAGHVKVVSGQFLSQGTVQEVLLALDGERPGESMGIALCAAGDWNGDKKGDILAATPGDATAQPRSWTVRVFSGADGAVLWKASGPAGDFGIGGVALAGDADGDGKPDVAVGTPASKSKSGVVSLLSANDSSELWSVKGAPNEMLGAEIHSAADADGDGVRDLVVLAPGAAADGVRGNGSVRVLSGKTGATLCSINPLSTK